MKNKILLLLLACGLFTASCINDTGNYEYIDPNQIMPVTISGLRDTTIISFSTLRIEPNVQHADNRHEYHWYVFPSQTIVGAPNEKTILSNERILDVPIKLIAGPYYLNLEVRDKETGIYARQRVNLTVSGTNINTGWYVLKDDGYETDFDYVNKNGVLFPDVLIDNRLKGKAVNITFQPSYYTHQIVNPDGTTTNFQFQPALHVVSSEDMKTFAPATLMLYKNFEDQFFNPFQERKVQSFRCAGFAACLYLINDGKLYTIYGMSPNIGKFGVPRNTTQYFHKDLISSYMAYGCLVFDTVTNTFHQTLAYTGTLDYMMEDAVGLVGISPSNMPYTLINLMNGPVVTSTTTSGIAIMKRNTDGKYFFVGINYSGSAMYPFTSFAEIPEGSKMPFAEVKAAPNSGSFVFFGDENKLCAYRNVNVADRETVLKTYPAGEVISYISHLYGYDMVWGVQYDYVVVLTNSAAGWKLYVHTPMSAGNPEIADTPLFTASGKGFARYAMYRH